MKWPADRISQSSKKSFGMYEKAIPMMEAGVDLIHLEVGMPSFDTPSHIKQATKKALDEGLVHYGDFAGNRNFRETLAAKLKLKNQLAVDPDEILVTNGLTHASYATCMAALDPGDEVIVLEPYYPQHINKIELTGAKLVPVPLDAARGYHLDSVRVEAAINARTRMIALVNPANPTGRVFTRTELIALAEIAIRHDLLVMSDEVYEQIVYDDHKHISIASLPGMFERTISMFAFTKAYAMDGWRLGYAVASQALMPALLKVTMNDVAHVNVFIQEGGRAAVSESQSCVQEMVAEDCRRRDLIYGRMNNMPLVNCALPEGTIYAFPDVSAFGIKSADLADRMLDEVHVVTEAGTFYGSGGEGHLRVCFGAEPYERLEQAMGRLDTFFSRLAKAR